MIYVSGRLMSFAPGDGTRPVGLDELTSVEGAHASRRFVRRFVRRCARRFTRRFPRRFVSAICSAICSANCSAILSAIFAGAFVPTASMQRDGAMLEPWLRRMEPLILVGPEGAGKNLLLSKLFAGQRGTQVENTTTRLLLLLWEMNGLRGLQRRWVVVCRACLVNGMITMPTAWA